MSAAAAGCGTYCQQAGNSAGNSPPGYPCAAGGCLPCPASNCVTVGSTGATASNGVISVPLTCNLSTACQGAFLLCLPSGTLCQVGQTFEGAGGRLAGSDFVVPAGATGDITVALTALGQQAASGVSSFGASVIVDLLNYGTVLDSSNANFQLSSADPPVYPAGTAANCGASVFAGQDTTCPFALNVVAAYAKTAGNTNATVTAVSPVTGQQYTMQCTGQSPVVCTGGTNALVAFYN